MLPIYVTALQPAHGSIDDQVWPTSSQVMVDLSATGFGTRQRDYSHLANTIVPPGSENAFDSRVECELGRRFSLERWHAGIVYSIHSNLSQSLVTSTSHIPNAGYHQGLCTAYSGGLSPSAEECDLNMCLDKSPLFTREDTNFSLVHGNIHSVARQMHAPELGLNTAHPVACFQQQWRIQNTS